MTAPHSTDASSTQELALFRAAPALRRTIGHLPLGRYPTPLERLQAGGTELLVKRDDITADGYGGNKVRKLEFLLAEARARGATRIVTAGATGSHHGFATAYHGIRHGFDVSLVLFPQRLNPHVGDMLRLMAAAGAELRWVRRMEAVPWAMWRMRMAHGRRTTSIVPPGGSNATGTLGYVNAALELAEQIAAESQLRPARVHVAAGTLGTVAGLAVGLAWAGLELPVRATRITSRLVTNDRVLGRLVRDTVALLRARGADPPDATTALRLVSIGHDHIGTGYGHATPEGDAASASFEEAGLALDPTYTAKAAAALLADERSRTDRDRGPLLFWHTLSAVHPPVRDLPAAAADLPADFAAYLAGASG
jgi:D-cysteine desulfhydrase